MSILTKEKILEAIERKEIKVEPYHPNNVGPGSIDLTLGNKFRVFETLHEVYDVDEKADYKSISHLIAADSIIIHPQETILGITEERITLPNNICGWLEGRSRFARLGLMVHISASFMQPGISNRQVLEISNMGHVAIRLHAGTRICQFIFEHTDGEAHYEGQFTNQKEP